MAKGILIESAMASFCRTGETSLWNYITIGRRHGKEWYVDSIAGSHGAELDIPLEFLGQGDYIADVYSDAPDAAYNPTHTVVEQKKVNRTTRIRAAMVSGGGQAIRLRPQ